MFKYVSFYRIEYVALSKDVTDADLKQRRELQNSTSFYVDQAAVRAAIHGRILVLDGIEKAERNVLPILNNLLENREMSLDDGRFLTTKDVKDTTDTKFEKVSPRFLVFALGKLPCYLANSVTDTMIKVCLYHPMSDILWILRFAPDSRVEMSSRQSSSRKWTRCST